MLYRFLKIWVRLALRFYCSRIDFAVEESGQSPAILACNHPNSFLDAVIVATHYKKQLHFLARGDAFSKPWIAWLLRRLNLIPVYRLSEGREHLTRNAASFDECLDVLEKGGTLLIFAEGICRNEWGLRPLKKGTARLIEKAWFERKQTNVVVRPLSLSYSSFRRLPVAVHIRQGAAMTYSDRATSSAGFYLEFNDRLQRELEHNLLPKAAMRKQGTPQTWRKTCLAIPAAFGWLTHIVFYAIVKNVARRKTNGTVFYHSVLFALLLVAYPPVLLVVTACVALLTNWAASWLLLLLLPFTAWSYKEWKGMR